MEVDKQQLIDKAIDELYGEYPFPPHAYLHKAGSNYFSCDSQVTDVIGSHYVCSFNEFHLRRAELSQNQHWYDYENRKALRLPPVGEVVEVLEFTEYFKATVVVHHDDIAVCAANGKYKGAAMDLLRPVDWDKLVADDLYPLVDLLNSFSDSSITGIAMKIIEAGYRLSKP